MNGWLAFNSDYYLNDLLKEKFINVKLLVDATYDQPSCIDTLSDASKSLLMEFLLLILIHYVVNY